MEDGDIHPSVQPLSVRITFSLKGKTKRHLARPKKTHFNFYKCFNAQQSHISPTFYTLQTFRPIISTLLHLIFQPVMTVASKVIAVVMVRVDRDEMDRRLHTTEVSLMV